MPVKKTTTVKKAPIKKTTTNKKVVPIKSTTSKPSVIVETKKTDKKTCCSVCNCEKFLPIITFVLLVLILIFSLLNFFKKDRALKLEEIKAGGHDNLTKVLDFYNSDIYKDEQTRAIDQSLSQINMMNNLSQEEIQSLMNGEEEIEFELSDIEGF